MGDHDPTISSSPATTTPTVSAKFREAATALATELELDVDLVINRVLEKKLVSTASDKAAAALTKVPDAKFAEAFSEKSEAEVAMATEAMREALNPEGEFAASMALPPDPELRADLCAPTWSLTPSGILIESKDDIRTRLGRSTDKGDAAVMSLSEGNAAVKRMASSSAARPTRANMGFEAQKRMYRR